MRITMLCSDFYPKIGGMAVLNRRLAHALTKRGHHITVMPLWWTRQCRAPDGIDDVKPLFTVRKYPSRFGGLPMRTIWAEARYYVHGMIKSDRFQHQDLIHADIGAAALVGLQARKRFGIPVTIGLGGHVFAEQAGRGLLSQFVTRITRKILTAADAVIVDGADITNGLVKNGLPRSRLHVILNALELSELTATGPIPTPDEENNRVLFWGRLVPENGPDDLVRAACHMPGTQIDIAGSGPMYDTLQDLIHELNVDDQVHLLGRLPQDLLYQQIAQSSLCVFPLVRIGGVSQVVAEAMAMGKAVVTTRVGSMEQLVTDRSTGLLVPPRQPQQLADSIEKLLGDRVLRNRIAQAGSNFVKQHWNWSSRVQEYECVFDQLVRQRDDSRNAPAALPSSRCESAS